MRVRTADERGITLQTLIVTAVLVLMAVAAGVVIVAITNSASDDLEEQSTSIDGNCNPVEVFDPTIASRNIKGTNAGQEGSAIGCIPVCIFKASDASGEIAAGEIDFMRSQASLAAGTGTATDGVKVGQEFLFEEPKKLFTAGDIAGTSGFRFKSPIAEVRVTADQRQCLPYDSRDEVVLS